MSRTRHLVQSRRMLLPALVAMLALTACGHSGESRDEARVRKTFEEWQDAIVDSRVDQSMVYMPKNIYDYFQALNSGGKPPVPSASAPAVTGESPGVDLLLRTALSKKVAAASRSGLTLNALVQLAIDKHLFKPKDVKQIKIGYIAINGDHASADIYYQGTLTALRLPFLKEGNDWKIDVLAIFPYIEVLMRVDRAIKGETEAQQVDRLVSAMPML